MSKTQPFGADRCPNCGEYEAHYCGPSFGEPGFFICEKRAWREELHKNVRIDKNALGEKLDTSPV